jgi:hypothetical protein
LWIAFANTYGDPNGNGGHIGNAYGNRDSYGNGDCIGNAYGNRNSYRGAEAYADPQAASYTAASALRSALACVSSGDSRSTRESPFSRPRKSWHTFRFPSKIAITFPAPLPGETTPLHS